MNDNKKRVNKKAHRARKTDYNLSELEAFAHAAYKSYLSIISSRPDAIIAPLRGAEPIIKAINLYANEEKKSALIPPVFYPRTGQLSIGKSGEVIDKTAPGFSPSQKESEQLREINRSLDKIIKSAKRNYKNKIHITVIDEVRHGGSVSQAVDLIDELLRRKKTGLTIDISVLAIAEKKAYRSKPYIHLKTRKNFKEFLVPRVFTMDSGRYLFPLIKEKSKNWPYKTRIRLGITRKAIEGRAELLADMLAIRKVKNGTHGKAKASARFHKIPK